MPLHVAGARCCRGRARSPALGCPDSSVTLALAILPQLDALLLGAVPAELLALGLGPLGVLSAGRGRWGSNPSRSSGRTGVLGPRRGRSSGFAQILPMCAGFSAVTRTVWPYHRALVSCGAPACRPSSLGVNGGTSSRFSRQATIDCRTDPAASSRTTRTMTAPALPRSTRCRGSRVTGSYSRSQPRRAPAPACLPFSRLSAVAAGDVAWTCRATPGLAFLELRLHVIPVGTHRRRLYSAPLPSPALAHSRPRSPWTTKMRTSLM